MTVRDAHGRTVAIAFDGLTAGLVPVAVDATRLALSVYALRAVSLGDAEVASQRFVVVW